MSNGRPWRQMRVGEVVREGDQFLTADGDWVECVVTLGVVLDRINCANFRTRRP